MRMIVVSGVVLLAAIALPAVFIGTASAESATPPPQLTLPQQLDLEVAQAQHILQDLAQGVLVRDQAIGKLQAALGESEKEVRRLTEVQKIGPVTDSKIIAKGGGGSGGTGAKIIPVPNAVNTPVGPGIQPREEH